MLHSQGPLQRWLRQHSELARKLEARDDPLAELPANTEAKYLMLAHAFETWGCMRVEFKTSRTNQKSQNAMRRLGLVEEGMFRKWTLLPDGSPRDVVWFSVIDDEWPAMKARLEEMLR